MGTFGYGIMENDTASDIAGIFKKLYMDKLEIEEIEEKIEKMYRRTIEDEEEGPLFWCFLSDLEWKYGVLTERVKEKALKFLETGGDVEVWKEDLGEHEANKRKKALEKLEKELKSPQPKKKVVRKRKPYMTDWEIGDVYAYKLESEDEKFKDKYIACVMVGHQIYEDNGQDCAIVYVFYDLFDELPKLEELRNIRYLRFSSWCKKFFKNNKEGYMYRLEIYVESRKGKEKIKKFIKIGNDKSLIRKPEDEKCDAYYEINDIKGCWAEYLDNYVIDYYNSEYNKKEN